MTKELRENFTYRDALTSTDITVTGYDNVGYTFSFYGERPVSIAMGDSGPPITVSKSGGANQSFGTLPESGSSPDVGWRSRMIQDNLSNVNSVEYNAGYRHVSSTLYDNLYSVSDSEIVSINVGCVSPVCDPFESMHEGVNSVGDYYPYWTGCNSNLTHNFLSGMSTDSANNFLFDSRRFNALSEVSYVKTSYSEFGPGVDVYAPGNGTLAAITNFKSGTFRPPNTTVSSNEKYGFFNGTSAACPVAAGCLATFLADNPTASPKAAKQWLIDASLKNSILETSFETHDDNPTDDIFDCDEWRRHDSIPMATKVSNPELLDGLYYSTAYGPAALVMPVLSEEKRRLAMLHNHRLFKSHNRVVQAYPLRKAIVKQFTDPPLTNITIGSTLTLSGGINPDGNTFITHLSADRF